MHKKWGEACLKEGPRAPVKIWGCWSAQAHHLANIITNNEKLWYEQVGKNKHVQNKAKTTIRWLQKNCDSITILKQQNTQTKNTPITLKFTMSSCRGKKNTIICFMC